MSDVLSYPAGETFSKAERLCRKKLIDDVYANGMSIKSAAMVFVYMPVELDEPVPVQVLMTVSKRLYKRAHDRNRIKRLMREAYRRHKSLIYEPLVAQQKQMALMIIFTGRQMPNYAYVYGKLFESMKKLKGQLSKPELKENNE